jgi:hypothetical protein
MLQIVEFGMNVPGESFPQQIIRAARGLDRSVWRAKRAKKHSPSAAMEIFRSKLLAHGNLRMDCCESGRFFRRLLQADGHMSESF